MKNTWFRLAPVAICLAVILLGTTACTADNIPKSQGEFYLRYLSTEEMAVADALAEEQGVKVYFDGLKSGDWFKQYFAINKLVEYYNDENIRKDAVKAITPFLKSENEKISDAAVFALSVLTQTFDDPRIIHMTDGTMIFALFNDYSDYGTYNKLWRIKDGELTEYMPLREPHMYIREMILSPDAKLLAVYTISNKSGYVVVYDTINGNLSSELIDSARILIARDMGYALRQRMDFENYSGAHCFRWLDDNTFEFEAFLSGDIEEPEGLSYGGLFVNAIVRYDSEQKHIDYGIKLD